MRFRSKLIISLLLAAFFIGLFSPPQQVYASEIFTGLDVIWTGTDEPEQVVTALQVLLLVSFIALAPTLLLLMTGFTRIVIVLGFGRQAMATQQMPPNQVLVGIALFLTIFIMTPVFYEINQNAITPFGAGEISTGDAINAAMEPIRRFMLHQLEIGGERGIDALELFHNLANEQMYSFETIPNYILIPAFILNELSLAFMMGFFIYLPFIVIDMITASILMSMGMMMLPPAMISMPFKIMVFILAGGWEVLIQSLLVTFGTV